MEDTSGVASSLAPSLNTSMAHTVGGDFLHTLQKKILKVCATTCITYGM